MLHRTLFCVALLCTVLVSHPALCADSQTVPNVEPKADEILRQMGEYLGSVEQFTFHAEGSIDQVLDTGQKLMYTASIDAAVRRPDGFQVDVNSDLAQLRFWYDGKNFTLFGKNANFYAVAEAPPEINAALEDIGTRFGATPPLSDFALSDPYAGLIGNVQSGYYVGLHEVHGVKCHHLAFTQEDIDWQIWIEDGRMLVPRMLVITYKQVEGSPQYVAVLSNWNLSPRLPDSLFTFSVPEGAEQIEFLLKDLPIVIPKNKK